MVWPYVIGAAVAIGGGIAQWLNSEQGRRASADERRKLEELLAKVSVPNPDASALTPEDYKVVAKHVPEIAPFIAESNPTLVRADTEGAVLGRDAQTRALRALMARAETQGVDPDTQLAVTEALAQADTANRGRLGAISENFAHRGMAGGPMELAAQLSNAQAANSDASANARAVALDAVRQRLQALRDSASLGGQIRGEDVALESENAGILNSWNRDMAERQQQHAQYAADTRNRAQERDIANQQDVANRNVASRNAAAVSNVDRANAAQQQRYDNEMAKLGIQSGIAGVARGDALNQARDRNAAIAGASEGAQTVLGQFGSGSSQAQPKPQPQNVWAGPDQGTEIDPVTGKPKKKMVAGGNPLSRTYV